MSNEAEPVYIPDNLRASLHFALARANDTGMVADIVLSYAADIGNKDLARRLTQAGNSMRKGQSYTSALSHRGLLTEFDRSLLTAGEEAGNIGHMHNLLARRYEVKYQRHSRLRARMLIPIITGVLALFIVPLPELIGSSITLFQYLLRSLGAVILMLVICLYCRNKYRSHEALGWPGYVTKILTAVPTIRKWLLTSTRAILLENMATLIEAGVPIQQALSICADSADNEFSRQLSERARSSVVEGAPVAQSLAQAGLLDQREGFAIVSTGEAAGKLPESLHHHALACRTQMDQVWHQLSEWTPRVIYAVIAALIIKDIFIQYSASLAGALILE